VKSAAKATVPSINACADRPHATRLAHGRVLLSGDAAAEALTIVRTMIGVLMDRNQAPDLKTIIRLMRLQRDFNRQLLDSGKVLVTE
jgi:hypothetical protein